MKKIFKKQYLRVLMVMLMTVALILALAGCTMPAVSNPDGSDTVAGVAIKNGLNILEAVCVTALSVAAAAWAAQGKEQKNFQNTILAVQSVLDMARLTVGELKQDTVDRLKELNGGKLSDEQIKEINAELLSRTLKKLSEPTKNLLTAVGIDICALISGAGEDWVRELKVQNGISLDSFMDVSGVVEGTVVDLNKKNDTVNSEAEPVVLVHPNAEAAKDASERRVAPLRGEPEQGETEPVPEVPEDPPIEEPATPEE